MLTAWWPFNRRLVEAVAEPVPAVPVLVEYVRPDPEKTYLFEYGELQQPLGYVDLLPAPLFPAFSSPKFSMWGDREQENVPIAVDFGYASRRLVVPRLRIKGGLYEISEDDLKALDEFRGNGVYFKRKDIQVVLPIPNDCNDPVEIRAFIYIASGKEWASRIQWDQDFYRGSSRFVPTTRKSDGKPWFFGDYYEFTASDMNVKSCRNIDPKCYLYHHRHIADPIVPTPKEPIQVNVVNAIKAAA